MTSATSGRPDRRRAFRVARVLIVLGLLVAVGAIAIPAAPLPSAAVGSPVEVASAQPVAGPSVVNISMNLTDAPSFVPSSILTQPGDLVQIRLSNVGVFNHTFTLSATANTSVPRNVTPTIVFAFFNHVGTLANVSLAPGGSGWANVTMPSANTRASFFFASVVPFQLQAGMFGWLNVTPRPSGAPAVLKVQATNTFSFVPNVLAVNTSSFPVAVAVQVGNLGTITHTWTLSPLANYNLSSSNFTDFFTTNPPLANAMVPTSPGVFVWSNFTVEGKGVYEFICTVPSHFASGMFGFLYVGVQPPPTTQPPSTEIVQVWFLVGAGAILGIGVIVAVAAALVPRGASRVEPNEH